MSQFMCACDEAVCILQRVKTGGDGKVATLLCNGVMAGGYP